MEESVQYAQSIRYSRKIPPDAAKQEVAITFSKTIYPFISDGETYAISVTTDTTDPEYLYKRLRITKVIKTIPMIKWIPVSWRRRLSILFKGGYYDYS